MAIDSLLEKLQVSGATAETSQEFRTNIVEISTMSATSATSRKIHDVSPKPASTLACTSATPATSQITNVQSKKSDEELKREQRRLKVLAMLDSEPEIRRAVISDATSDRHNVILTFAIRNCCTFEMWIERLRYDGLEVVSILHHLDGINVQH